MATAETDADLDLKKRARRRLVGAVALALLAAIVLPMVMDREPQPLNQDIQVRIPSRDSPFDGRVQPPATPAVEQESPATPAQPAPPVAVQSQAENKVAEQPRPKAPKSEAPQPAVEVESPKPVVAERQPEKKAAKAADKPAEKLAKAEETSTRNNKADKVDDARARAILNGGAQTDAPAADRSGQFIVQLGVFGDPGNARKVQARVKSEGYNSSIEQLRTATGTKTRVRAGPFASRESAEQARAKLKQRGLDGIVAVAPKS